MQELDSVIVQSYMNLINFRIGLVGCEGKMPSCFAVQKAIRKSHAI